MDPGSHLRSSRRANALMLVLGIALLLGIQIYIVQTFAVGGFRHVEKVNSHMRSIYVGEAAFSRVLARLKADRWEKRWFFDGEKREFNLPEPATGGTYSTVVRDVNPPIPGQNLVDVWIEARYEQSMTQMYYRVAYVDDTLDFTAQVFPRFFTFLSADDPDPFSGSMNPAENLVNEMIKQQEANEAAAVAALEGVKASCNLAGAGSSLSIPFTPGALVDQYTPLGGNVTDLCTLTNGIKTTLNGLPVPPLPLPLPPPPTPPANGADVVAILKAVPGMPSSPPFKIDPPASGYFEDISKAQQEWLQGCSAHYGSPRPKGHELKDHIKEVFNNMLKQREADPVVAPAIEAIVVSIQGKLRSEASRFGTPTLPYLTPSTTSEYQNNYDYLVQYLYDNSGGEYQH